MRMHVLAATVVVALASRAALAFSEGGDTWSAIQLVEQQGEPLPQFTPRVDPPVARQITWEGSEGGDTWSQFLPRPQAQSTDTAGLILAPAEIE